MNKDGMKTPGQRDFVRLRYCNIEMSTFVCYEVDIFAFEW